MAQTTQLPILVDCHVHFRDPGLTDKADMLSESTAAHFGGISVVCDMPNTVPPTQTIASLKEKVERASAVAHLCDIRFFFGATSLEHLKALEELWTEPVHAELKSRCSGLKLYLDNSTGNLKSSQSVTETSFALCGRLGITLVAHCEHGDTNDAACAAHPYCGPASHTDRRPQQSEVRSVQEALTMAKRHLTPLHVAHVSTAGALEAIRQARASDPHLQVTCEVTPHHLFLTSADYATLGAKAKVNPPIRPAVEPHQEALWAGLLDGTVDCIGTDHAPHLLSEKHVTGEQQPPSGMPGIEVVLSLLLSACNGVWPHPTAPTPACWGTSPRTTPPLTLQDITRLMHTNPNRIFHLQLPETPVTTVDLAAEWEVTDAAMHSKCKWTPYAGWKLRGRPVLSK